MFSTKNLIDYFKQEGAEVKKAPIALVVILFVGSILGWETRQQWDARQMGIMQARLDAGDGSNKKAAEKKIMGAHVRLYRWASTMVDGNKIELIGQFINSGDTDTVITVTNQVFLDGRDVTSPTEKGPDRLELPAQGSSPEGKTFRAGPIFYFDGAVAKSIKHNPGAVQIQSHISYPNGLGQTSELNTKVEFRPGLRLVITGS